MKKAKHPEGGEFGTEQKHASLQAGGVCSWFTLQGGPWPVTWAKPALLCFPLARLHCVVWLPTQQKEHLLGSDPAWLFYHGRPFTHTQATTCVQWS